MSDQQTREDYEMAVADALGALAEFYETQKEFPISVMADVQKAIPVILREFERQRKLFKAGAEEIERMSLLANDALRDVRRCRETLRAIANTYDSAQQRDIARMALRGDYWGGS